jgi:hypothetical protein
MLVPRALDPVEAGAQMPLPQPKPALIATKPQEKGKAAKLRHRQRWRR